jgi:serine/threonine protein kinase
MAGTWPKSTSELTFDKLLGKGFVGEVWSCRFLTNPSKAPIAVKTMPLKLVRQLGLTEQIEREIEILGKLDHPHIVRLHSNFRDHANVYLAMEFLEGGSMFDRLSKFGKFTLTESAQYFYEICDALEYMHTLPEQVIHRDIKPENILFDKDGHVKLADFGSSNMMEGLESADSFVGTPLYFAPEMVRHRGHNESLDMWEMGVLLYEMIVGKPAFAGATQEKTRKRVLRCDLRFSADMDPDAEDCIQCLCKINPEERLTATQAKEHAFVVKYHLDPAAQARLLADVKLLLQAKSKLEQQMLHITTQVEEGYEQLRQERTRADTAVETLISYDEVAVGKSYFASGTQDQTHKGTLRCDFQCPADMDPADNGLRTWPLAKDCVQGPRKRSKRSQLMVAVGWRRGPASPRDSETIKFAATQAEQHASDLPTDVVGLTVDPAHLQEDIKLLMEAKSKLEQQMLDITREFEQCYEQLLQERARADTAEAKMMQYDKEMRQKRATERRSIDELRAAGRLFELGGFSNRGYLNMVASLVGAPLRN